MYEQSFPEERFQKTLEFLENHISRDERILDLGVPNPFSKIMEKEGFQVNNTRGEDLDDHFEAVQSNSYDCITAFEIFEHLLAPYNILKEIKAQKLLASVPLNLWFTPAYRSKTDPWDRHYHEFEKWQFDWLLEKSGWQIKDSIQWAHPVKKIGLRPILRKFTPRYYAVYAERI
ncbi:hypothetical protein JM79_0677 [Gramella sp. Hel_I_59]|uniref:methyltransferase domain-containing protein n=1 Tax=Gramella sp. Hel_I_59 TaxID=1249978 RepID=UPI0011502886|nr:methyltransferase domain-containing protein [Gramella sp. Hel_I_59]TQI69784.1 hypothetical protein JM79_0677 [Gramella sp. Hel_I_59]